MLFEDAYEFEYAKLGCWMVLYPRWLRRVLRAVGEIGDGEMGERRGIAMATGDGRLRESLGCFAD